MINNIDRIDLFFKSNLLIFAKKVVNTKKAKMMTAKMRQLQTWCKQKKNFVMINYDDRINLFFNSNLLKFAKKVEKRKKKRKC